MPTPDTTERTRKPDATGQDDERTGEQDATHDAMRAPTKEDLLRDQELSVERQREGHGWAGQSKEERHGEAPPPRASIEPQEGEERSPVRNTARLAEEGQRAPPKRREDTSGT